MHDLVDIDEKNHSHESIDGSTVTNDPALEHQFHYIYYWNIKPFCFPWIAFKRTIPTTTTKSSNEQRKRSISKMPVTALQTLVAVCELKSRVTLLLKIIQPAPLPILECDVLWCEVYVLCTCKVHFIHNWSLYEVYMYMITYFILVVNISIIRYTLLCPLHITSYCSIV